jgi:hypothetical protein
LVESAEIGHGTLFYLTAIVPVGLNELNVLARTRGCDLDVHATTLQGLIAMSIDAIRVIDVPPQGFVNSGG